MLGSIDSCQNSVSADQYHLTVSQAQVSIHRGPVFFLKLSADKLLVFKWSQAQLFFSFINMLCLCAAQWKFWFQTDLGRENLATYYGQGSTVAFDFCYHGHTLVTFYVQFLCSDWSKFDRGVHSENLCSILKLVYFYSWSWQSFVSTCDVFNRLFLLDVQEMKFSCYQESSVIRG